MKNERPVLVILIPGFPQNEADSTCLPAQQTIIRNINCKFPFINIIILSFQYPFKKEEYTWNNNQVVAFGGRNKGGISRLLLWRQVRKKFKQLENENNIIGILSFWCGECALIGKQLSRKNGISHYCWIMGQDAKKENHYVRRIKPDAGELIAISDFASDEFNKNHSVIPGHVIPIGIDAKEFEKENRIRDIDVLAVGSLIPLKQYDVFLQVIASLKKQMPGIKAVLAGDGPEKEKLQSSIEKLELKNNVLLTGELPHKEILQLMQRTKIFLHTSSYEGFGIVCLEALYAGATVISFTKPMTEPIPNWYRADSKEAMVSMVSDFLNSSSSYKPELPYTIEETVEKIMRLFVF